MSRMFVGLTVNSHLLKKIDTHAKTEHRTRSGTIRMLCEEALRNRKQTKPPKTLRSK
jgi:metal-responsive CopG/Arc/MetJ family transcriptional regulator